MVCPVSTPSVGVIITERVWSIQPKEMPSIKDLALSYEALNEENTFTQGDTIMGKLSFTLTKDTKVKSLGVKVKGHAYVHWTEGTGDRRRSHTANRKFFNVKKKFVEKASEGTVLSKGDHCHKFSLKIPEQDMPSSFKGFHGKITYMLEAKMSRSMRMASTEQKELKFVSKSIRSHSQGPLSTSLEKGGIQMTATVDKNVCSPGGTFSVVAKIANSSSKTMKPKFNLMQTVIYNAHSSRKHSFHSQCKMVGESIGPKSHETASCQLQVPTDAVCSVTNCDIISVTYAIKVYLDIKLALDPEVQLPVFIAPAKMCMAMGPYSAGPAGAPGYSDFPPPSFPMGPYSVPAGPSAPFQPGQAQGPYPVGAVGAPAFSQFPPPTFPAGPYPAPTGPAAYGYPAPDPTQPPPTASGYNQWPQQPPPYGYPTAPFPPSLVQPQAPAGENPPGYHSLFPPPHSK
ncbi:arrestin domain-containing protein 3-like [Notolabrus celidotus]|uniref:arrestin domain-containing protein 3-like n=1 Tax=Notolabrus celidotus TaxID=1203425 RepID=UPI0014902086|nr:arrestin domain-containing protein 3-like [Notolabrus celidotus]